ncbi:RND superfamily putative drug exporter [Mycolicibacterium sp. BK556]|uniref:MMPL/RND family transporter n=1 Tax=Mycobacteriaceae TaxID=1762 RepID=UPI00105DB4E4|nr:MULTISPECIES: RND family transporter [Mycobacteriaceae]MBB3606918.1 RND superfamily putative drug exporter [Mycolicibacterium sp. BK556]MBB3636675.1 RND superfamily putative drug exporter [Mycolicibacterium sp. BK607]MBB3753022.1 RND superfamily putative drug exporter [Mycolicibacterium sp. BK634]TDO09210.1 RND superfamily putative drug exporter [Mycobacterium sp. BK086]
MSNHELHSGQSVVAKTIRRFSALIILGWLAVVVGLTLGVPTLEQVEAEHSISQNPTDAPSFRATQRMSEVFQESVSGTAAVMIVLEGQQPLGDEAHAYYDGLIRQLRSDPKHVQHIQNFWGDPLTSAAAESDDGKAAYVQLSVTGKPGEAMANESVRAVQHIIAETPAPPGIKTYVTGPAALAADMSVSGNSTVTTITLVSILVILVTLLFVYRSPLTVILLLMVVGVQLQAARGFVALLGHHEIIGLTTFAVNLLVALVIAAGTDYGIFFIGRYHEARLAGEDKETAFYTTYRGVAHVVLATGSTVAGATLCLHFTRLPAFQALGIPCAVGIMVAVAVALTLVPAVIAVGSRFGLFEPKRTARAFGWRRIGTAIVRWPGPILVASLAVTLIGLLTLPGFKPDYNDQHFLPKNIPATEGIQAASRHFSPSAMMSPEVLMVETDHDLRNPADFLVLNKLAKAVLAVPGIEKVQAVTRPEGTPIAHTTIPYLMSTQQAGQQQFMFFQKARMADLLTQADQLQQSIDIMSRMYGLMKQMSATMHEMVKSTHEMADITMQLRDHIADFEDFFRPIRNYLYWEPHCFNIPLCWSVRSIFDILDGVDGLTEKLQQLVGNLDQMDVIMPQLLAQFPEMISIMEGMRGMLLTMHSTMSGVFGQMDDNGANSTAMGKAFDAAQNDDSFYVPPEVFKNEDFKRVMKIFISPDGKAVRMLISQKGDPTSPDGIARVDAIKSAAEEALKGTPLEGSQISLSGTAALVKDLVTGTRYDMMIAVVAALCLIFVVMLIVTRSLIAAMVIVGTVLLSLGASFGLAVFVWQYLLGIPLHWSVFVMTVIILLAVGSDYNLLLVARMKEELGAGINTGIIRAMAGTGKVVTTAGLVFAFTMASMMVSDLVSIGQLGTTIALGLLFDTLVVRAFMTPSIAALLGRWFWWPQRVRPRPASTMLRPTGPRPLVRALLLNQEK